MDACIVFSLLKFCVPSFLYEVLYVSAFLSRVLYSIFPFGDAVYIHASAFLFFRFSARNSSYLLGLLCNSFPFWGVFSLYICNVYIHVSSSFICLVLPSSSCLYQGKVTTSTFPPPSSSVVLAALAWLCAMFDHQV